MRNRPFRSNSADRYLVGEDTDLKLLMHRRFIAQSRKRRLSARFLGSGMEDIECVFRRCKAPDIVLVLVFSDHDRDENSYRHSLYSEFILYA
jgi:predicted glycosyltransferase involved in capsule biosynthesis